MDKEGPTLQDGIRDPTQDEEKIGEVPCTCVDSDEKVKLELSEATFAVYGDQEAEMAMQQKLNDESRLRKLGDPKKGFDGRAVNCPNNALMDRDHNAISEAAKSARDASYLACSSSFWKNVEPIFANVSSEDASYLQQQLNFTEQLEKNLSLMFGAERSFTGHTSFYQLTISALIDVHDMETLGHDSERNYGSFQIATDSSILGASMPQGRDGIESGVNSTLNVCTWIHNPLDNVSNDRRHSFGSVGAHDPLSNGELKQRRHSSVAGVTSGFNQVHLDSTHVRTNIHVASSSDCEYEQMSDDKRHLLELASIDIHPEKEAFLPGAVQGEIDKNILELWKEFFQKVRLKKSLLDNLNKDVQEAREMETRKLEQLALDKLVERAYKKYMAPYKGKCRGAKVSKKVALNFAERAILNCREFENSGRSCFSKPPYAVILFGRQQRAPTTSEAHKIRNCKRKSALSVSATESQGHVHDGDNLDKGLLPLQPGTMFEQDSPKLEPKVSRWKKRIVLGGGSSASLKTTFACRNTPLGDENGNRSKSGRYQNKKKLTRNSISYDSQPSSFNAKHKITATNQKTDPGGPFVHGSNGTTTNGSCKVNEADPPSPGKALLDMSENPEKPMKSTELNPNDLDLGKHQDIISSWFDKYGVQEHDSMGLEIPTDDIPKLNIPFWRQFI